MDGDLLSPLEPGSAYLATPDAAIRALVAMRGKLDSAQTYEEIRLIQAAAEVLKKLHLRVTEVRQEAELTIAVAQTRVGEELRKAPVAKAGRPPQNRSAENTNLTPTLAEQVGSKQRGVALKKLAEVGRDKVVATVKALHAAGKEAGITVVLKAITGVDKKTRRAERERDLASKILALPDQKFGVVVEDFEWDFVVRSRQTGMDRHAANHYPVSESAHSAEEIVERTKDRFVCAADDCVLFMWTTVPYLAVAIDVMRLRGFRYVTNVEWNKDRIGTGFWFRNKHEHFLVGVRGNVPAPAPGTQWDSVISAPVGAHSAKPEAFLEMVEAYFPSLPKIELNRRGTPRPGWHAWGLEAEEAAE